MLAKKNPESSIPELIKSIRYSFRQCEFDEVRNVLMGREESMKVEIENLAKERDSLMAELDSLQMTQGFTELEKCSAEEKLGRSERRCEELDKLIVGTREDIEKLRGEKLDLEEKVVSRSRKVKKSDETLVKMQEENDILRSEKMDLEEKIVRSGRKSKAKDERLVKMEEEVEDLRRENAYVNKCLEELKARKIEDDSIVKELKLKSVEAVQTIDELREKNIESDKAIELYERVLSDLKLRVSKLEGTIANGSSMNSEDLASLVKGKDSFTAAATDVGAEETVAVSPELAATFGVENLPHSRTKEDDANIVGTSTPASNSNVAEGKVTVQENEGKEPKVRGMGFFENLARTASKSMAKNVRAEVTGKEAARQEVEPDEVADDSFGGHIGKEFFKAELFSVSVGLSPYDPATTLDPVKVNFGASKKKRPRSAMEPTNVAEMTVSEASFERMEDVLRSPSSLSITRRSKERRVATGAAPSDDEECKIVGTQIARPQFPQFPEDTEYVIAELMKTATRMTDRIVQFNKLARVAQDLDNEKSLLVNEVVAAEAKARDAAKREAAALAVAEVVKAEVALLKADAEAARCREAEAAASQGELLRAFAERLFLSGRFSGLVAELAEILETRVAAATLDKVVVDYPNLDKSKYGYEVMSHEAILWEYAETLSEGMKAFPIVESLASSSTILTVEAIRACSVDRDIHLEAMIAGLDDHAEEQVVENAEAAAKEARHEEEATGGVS